MPIYAVGEKAPAIHPSAFIAPTATVVGDVRIEAGASIWYGAVVRGDTSYAVIGPVILSISLSMGLIMAPSTNAVMGAVPRADAGVGSAMNDVVRQVGGALGDVS